MRRRRLALALAGLFVVVALALAGVTAIIELSPRDYRLVWKLRHTKRIEWSSPWEGSRIMEIDDPGEVAAIVSAVTGKLDRLAPRRQDDLGLQLRFVLDDGSEVVMLRQVKYQAPAWHLVSVPGEPVRAYATLDAFPLAGILGSKRTIPLGRLATEGGEVAVGFAYRMYSNVPGGSFSEHVNSRRCVLVVDRPRNAPLLDMKFRVVGRDGTLEAGEGCWGLSTLTPNGHRIEEHVQRSAMELADIDGIELEMGDVKTTYKLPRLRFDEQTLPSCPSCASERSVVPWVYNWSGPPPYRGRSKVTDAEEAADSPHFFCEKCQASF